MRFATWVFTLAGIYGIVVVAPQYGLESTMTHMYGPITYPEYFYGFIGVTLAFQVLFLIVGRNPARLRPVIPACVLEKVSFGAAVWPLHLAGRTPLTVAIFATIDFIIGALFVVSWFTTRDSA